MSSKLGLVLFNGLMLLLVSCAKSPEDAKPAYTADIERSIGEPRFSFLQEKQDIKLESLSSSEVYELMSCNQKSSMGRADRKKFSVSYGNVFRMMNRGHNTVLSEKYDYSTENREDVYELTTSILEYILAGTPLLHSGGISYRDSCSASSGCDQEKRKFIAGSPSYLLSVRESEKAVRDELSKRGKAECSLKSAKDLTKQVQKGQVRIGDNTYQAVQLTQKTNGKVYCQAGSYNESIFMGEGSEVKKTIYLLDTLVTASAAKSKISGPSSDSLGCSRTVAFDSQELIFEGTTISGVAAELVDYQFSGEILSLEDWNKKQSGIKQKIVEHKDEVVVKKATADRAQLNVSVSENEMKASESRLADLKLQLNEAIAGKKPTEEGLRTLVKDSEASVESARARTESAKNLLVVAQNQLKSAEDVLAAYIKENGTGEN